MYIIYYEYIMYIIIYIIYIIIHIHIYYVYYYASKYYVALLFHGSIALVGIYGQPCGHKKCLCIRLMPAFGYPLLYTI